MVPRAWVSSSVVLMVVISVAVSEVSCSAGHSCVVMMSHEKCSGVVVFRSYLSVVCSS
jgi:hypothetical protein